MNATLLWTTEDLAARLGFHTATVYGWISDGTKRLPPPVMVNPLRWFPPAVEKWMLDEAERNEEAGWGARKKKQPQAPQPIPIPPAQQGVRRRGRPRKTVVQASMTEGGVQ